MPELTYLDAIRTAMMEEMRRDVLADEEDAVVTLYCRPTLNSTATI